MKMKAIMVVAAFGIATQAFAAVTVTNVVCRQRYPWNGLVDIDYEILSDNTEAQYFVYPKGEDKRLGTPIVMHTLSGDGATEPVGVGTHRMTWDAKADMPAFHTSDFAVTIQAVSQGAQYLVVDLSGGTNAVTYPVRYSTTPPDITTDKCRTTELWLRLVLPGTFMMGSPEREYGHVSDEQQHLVHLTKPFYIGVFELTQKQWMLISGYTNALWYVGDCRPVDRVSYDMLRGTMLGAQWPKSDEVDTNSFMGIMRSKTSLKFDLPTEAQWEYACRAGTTTRWNNGTEGGTSSEHDVELSKLGRYIGNREDGRENYREHTKVGMYLPNAWNLYDMHGNVYELCRDRYQALLSTFEVFDPVGSEDLNANHVARGGAWNVYWSEAVTACRSASRRNAPSTAVDIGNYKATMGFRVVCLPVD